MSLFQYFCQKKIKFDDKYDVCLNFKNLRVLFDFDKYLIKMTIYV